MSRLAPALALLALLVACAPPGDSTAAPVVSKRGDLTIETRDLRGEATLAAVGLAPEGDRREGASTWDSTFTDAKGRLERDRVRRAFRITIVNRGATARDFHARIDYLAPEGTLVRRRSLDNLVVAPFTEMSWSGAVLLPIPGDAAALARVLPATESFEEPPSR